MGNINELKYYAYKILPLVYDDSLSYYEVISKVSSKLNEVIDTTNSLPNTISEEIKKQLDGDGDIYKNIFSGIINAIATDEGDAKFTETTKVGGEVIWINNKLYKVIVPMEAGTNYIIGTNIELINIEDELNRIQNFICNNNEHYNIRATNKHEIGDYIVYKDELYKCNKVINVNDLLNDKDDGNLTNVSAMSEILNINNFITELNTKLNNTINDLASTNLRVNNIVASTGSDNTEIVDGRTGNETFNHQTFATIGNAIRQETNYGSNWNKHLSAIPTIKQNNYIDVRTLITNSYVNFSGDFMTDNPKFDRTPYIDISGAEKLLGSGTKLSAFYDESHNFISAIKTFDMTGGVDVPTNAKYVVCSIEHNDVTSAPNQIALVKYPTKDYLIDNNYDYQLLKKYNWFFRTKYSIEGNTISFGFNLVLYNPTLNKTIQILDTTKQKENELKFNLLDRQLLVVDIDINNNKNYEKIDKDKISIAYYNDVGGKLVICYNTEEGITLNIGSVRPTADMLNYHEINKFTVNINTASLPTVTNDIMADSPIIKECNCGYIMPYNYSDNGKPSKLLMVCHGAGKGLFQNDDRYSWDKVQSYAHMLELFASAGYFCFDCTGYENTLYGFNFWGVPKGVQAWRKAYDYITNNFNVEKEFSIYGFSMGGLTAMELARTKFPNIKCIALGSPVINLEYFCNHDESALTAAQIAYEFTGNYDAKYTIGCDTSKDIISVENKDYCINNYPPIRMWYGSTEIGGVVEANTSDKLVNAIKNSNGIISKRIVDGRGHEICYGEDINVVNEIINFINRYNY